MVETHFSFATRYLHAALALAVGVHLLSSLVSQEPSDFHAGNVFFEIHKNSDLILTTLALLFWAVIATRSKGTDIRLVLPWFAAPARRALFADLGNRLSALRHGQLYRNQDSAPSMVAVQGLGLVAVTVMAMSGCVGEIDVLSRLAGLPWSDWALAVHDVMAAIVWIFLIGHGLMAILRHYAGSDDLRAIWSLHPKPETKKRGGQ